MSALPYGIRLGTGRSEDDAGVVRTDIAREAIQSPREKGHLVIVCTPREARSWAARLLVEADRAERFGGLAFAEGGR